LNDLSEVHDDLRILHPLPYARLHLEKCIEHQIACNDAVNAFIEAHTITVIDASPSLTLQLQELKKNLKKAWDARFAAAFLCEPPPTLSKVIWIVAKNGYTEEVIRCMNLNRATRNCKFLQPLMREVKDGEYGMTQLNYFAWKGLTKSVNRMLSMKGIDVESRDNIGDTPLISSAASGHVEIVEILLNHGAQVNCKDKKDCTSLHFACQEGHLPVVNLLINRGANIEASTLDGGRPLHNASDKGHVAIVKILITMGAMVEAIAIDGWSPLHIAAQNGHAEIVDVLIDKGANVNALTNNGQSALGLARRNNHTGIASILRTLNAVDDDFGMLVEGLGDDDEEEEFQQLQEEEEVVMEEEMENEE
jgi:ankyrin repeat protein